MRAYPISSIIAKLLLAIVSMASLLVGAAFCWQAATVTGWASIGLYMFQMPAVFVIGLVAVLPALALYSKSNKETWIWLIATIISTVGLLLSIASILINLLVDHGGGC